MRAQFICHWQFAEIASRASQLEPRAVATGRRRHRRWSPPAAIPAVRKNPSDGDLNPAERSWRRSSTTRCSNRRPPSAMWRPWPRRPSTSRCTRCACHRPWSRPRSAGRPACGSPAWRIPFRQTPFGGQGPRGGTARSRPARRDRHGHRCRGRLAGDLDAIRADVEAVRDALRGVVLKVIVESAALLELGGRADARHVCRAAEAPVPTSSRPRRAFTPPAAPPCAPSRSWPRRSAAASRSRPAVASAPPPTPWRCSTPVPPAWGCRAPAACSTAWLQPDELVAQTSGEAGVVRSAVHGWRSASRMAVTPVSVTSMLSA